MNLTPTFRRTTSPVPPMVTITVVKPNAGNGLQCPVGWAGILQAGPPSRFVTLSEAGEIVPVYR